MYARDNSPIKEDLSGSTYFSYGFVGWPPSHERTLQRLSKVHFKAKAVILNTLKMFTNTLLIYLAFWKLQKTVAKHRRLELSTKRDYGTKRESSYFMKSQGILACEEALLFGQAKWASPERSRRGLLSPAPRGFAARSRVLARLASLAQIGELARRLKEF